MPRISSSLAAALFLGAAACGGSAPVVAPPSPEASPYYRIKATYQTDGDPAVQLLPGEVYEKEPFVSDSTMVVLQLFGQEVRVPHANVETAGYGFRKPDPSNPAHQAFRAAAVSAIERAQSQHLPCGRMLSNPTEQMRRYSAQVVRDLLPLFRRNGIDPAAYRGMELRIPACP